ncbi:MAG: hypothetical protein ABI406_14915 [Ktedonobacteraceae bacterium]
MIEELQTLIEELSHLPDDEQCHIAEIIREALTAWKENEHERTT